MPQVPPCQLGSPDQSAGWGIRCGTKPLWQPAGESLRSLVSRIERLEEDRKAISEDIKEVYAEAKSLGFDPKIMRKALSLRKLDTDTRMEESDLLDIYMHALEGAADNASSVSESSATMATLEVVGE